MNINNPSGISVTLLTLQSIYAQNDDEKPEFEYESGNVNMTDVCRDYELLLMNFTTGYILEYNNAHPGSVRPQNTETTVKIIRGVELTESSVSEVEKFSLLNNKMQSIFFWMLISPNGFLEIEPSSKEVTGRS
jgi:hypothetical protein